MADRRAPPDFDAGTYGPWYLIVDDRPRRWSASALLLLRYRKVEA